MFKLLSKHAVLEWVFIDATHIQLYQHATKLKHQAFSNNIGGDSSEIHLAVDANGNPIYYSIYDGTIHGVKIVPELVDQID